jgi:hypothetical protein
MADQHIPSSNLPISGTYFTNLWTQLPPFFH